MTVHSCPAEDGIAAAGTRLGAERPQRCFIPASSMYRYVQLVSAYGTLFHKIIHPVHTPSRREAADSALNSPWTAEERMLMGATWSLRTFLRAARPLPSAEARLPAKPPPGVDGRWGGGSPGPTPHRACLTWPVPTRAAVTGRWHASSPGSSSRRPPAGCRG